MPHQPHTGPEPQGSEPFLLLRGYLSAERAGDADAAERVLRLLFQLLPEPVLPAGLALRVLAARRASWLDRLLLRRRVRQWLAVAAAAVGVALALGLRLAGQLAGELALVSGAAAAVTIAIDAAAGGLRLLAPLVLLCDRVLDTLRPVVSAAASSQALVLAALLLCLSASGLFTLMRLRGPREMS